MVYYNLAGGAFCLATLPVGCQPLVGQAMRLFCTVDGQTKRPRGRDLEFLGKNSFVDLARLLQLVGSREREEEGWSWVGLGWDQAVAWSIWQSGAASSNARDSEWKRRLDS